MFGWFLIIVAVAAVAFFLLRGRSGSSTAAKKRTKLAAKKAGKKRPKLYASRQFIADAHACDEAKALSGKSFLVDEGPTLPLANCCDPVLCRCKYRDVEDRRGLDERRLIVGALSTEMPIGDERSNRRIGCDRRKDDISFDYDS